MITDRVLLTCRLLLLVIVVFALVACEEMTAPKDTAPAFSTSVSNQTYTIGSEVALRLPSATGGDGRLTYTLTPRLPGLSFDASARKLAGTPTAEGTYAMKYRVADGDDDSDTQSFTITVATAPVTPSFDRTVSARIYVVDTAIAPLVLPAATGGNAPLTYSLTPDVPGVRFNSGTRTLSGTPTLAAGGSVNRCVNRSGGGLLVLASFGR